MLSSAFEHRSEPLPATDTHCFQSIATIPAAELAQQVGQDTPAGGADWMAK
jgi:hypothetical protein